MHKQADICVFSCIPFFLMKCQYSRHLFCFCHLTVLEIHIRSALSSSFFLLNSSIIIHRVDLPLFNPSRIYGHLGYFHYFAITNNAPMNNSVYMYFCIVGGLVSGWIPRNVSTDLKGKCICRLSDITNFPSRRKFSLICISSSNV